MYSANIGDLMLVLAVGNSKGGVGKTSIASHLGALAAEQGERVGFLDLDPQKSLTAWQRRRPNAENPDVYSGASVADCISRLMAHGDERGPVTTMIVDTGPAGLDLIRQAFAASTVVVVPITPSAHDLEASDHALRIAMHCGRPHLCVLNRVPARSVVVDEMRELLESSGVRVAKAAIPERPSVQVSSFQGLVGFEGGGDATLKKQIAALWKEIKALASNGGRK